MEIGKVPENVLKRSVMKQIQPRRKEILLGAGVGEDCAAVQLEADEVLVLSTDPITGTVQDIGNLAVQITVNDLASAGAEPIGILMTILLPPESEEDTLREIMQRAEAACEAANVQVMGGHTEVTAAVNQPLVSVTGVARVKQDRLIQTGGARPGMDILVTKTIGMEGTAIIAREKRGEMASHLAAVLLDAAEKMGEHLSVQKEAAIASAYGVAAMHDVTEGGIYGALWEMAEASHVGLEIDLKKIPLKQETVEICEFYGINPYELISSGSMLMAAKDGNGLVAELNKAGIAATVIGKATDTNDRVLWNEGEKRFLTPPKTDELYKVIVRK